MAVVIVVIVVELPQTPEDDHQKRESCAWKAHDLISICSWLLLLLRCLRRLRMISEALELRVNEIVTVNSCV